MSVSDLTELAATMGGAGLRKCSELSQRELCNRRSVEDLEAALQKVSCSKRHLARTNCCHKKVIEREFSAVGGAYVKVATIYAAPHNVQVAFVRRWLERLAANDPERNEEIEAYG